MFFPSQNSEMEKYSPPQMEIRTGKILRRSIYTFLQNYQYFTTTALLAFPFSSAILIFSSQTPPLLPKIHHHLHSLFDAAGFPPTSPFFAILNLKLSQTITSSILVLPFNLSFLLLSKSSTILALTNHHRHHKVAPSLRHSLSSLISVYNPILLTQICNSLVIISANSTFFCLLFFAFNSLEGFAPSSPASTLFLSSTGFVLYSIILANVLVICNLALVSSGTDKSWGCIAILKSCVLIRGRTATALALSLPANILLSGLEALFQFRVVRAHYNQAKCSSSCVVLEGAVIAYLYSIVIVIDTIVSCVFFKSCKAAACQIDDDQERSCSSWIDVEA